MVQERKTRKQGFDGMLPSNVRVFQLQLDYTCSKETKQHIEMAACMELQ